MRSFKFISFRNNLLDNLELYNTIFLSPLRRYGAVNLLKVIFLTVVNYFVTGAHGENNTSIYTL